MANSAPSLAITDLFNSDGWRLVAGYLRAVHAGDLKAIKSCEVLDPKEASRYLVTRGEVRRVEMILDKSFADKVRKFYEDGNN